MDHDERFLERSIMKKKVPPQTWVIKIGSQLLIDGGPLLIRALMAETAWLVKKKKVRCVWVSSGAIATARKKLDHSYHSLPEKQALSAIGQPLVMENYNLALHTHGLNGAQILLSYSDFARSESRNNFKSTIKQLLEWNIIPIINENDAVATHEIQFGDNDQLSAMVAQEIKADRLIILTNVNGVYDRHPDDPKAVQLSYISTTSVTSSFIQQLTKSKKSEMGRGGMSSKLLAAQRAAKSKIQTTIVKGDQPKVLERLYHKENLGTQIGPLKK
jgi:glutamate 5-kinase